MSRLKSKILGQLGIGLAATAIVIGTLLLWDHFVEKDLRAARQELLERRYPVKPGNPKPKAVLAPLPTRDAIPAGGKPVSGLEQ